MEADFCLAKRLEVNQGTHSTRLFAQCSIPPQQGLHAFVNHRQHGGYAGYCFELPREEQLRKNAQTEDMVCNLIHYPFVLTIPPEEASADGSEFRELPKIHHSATRRSSVKAIASPTKTFSCRTQHRLINNFAFKFFSTGNTPNGRNSILILNQSI